MLNETAAAAALVAAWSADVYVKRDVGHADALLGPLSRGCITLLCGPRGVGKSWLALALAHTAARGGTLAQWRSQRKHRVVFIDASGSEAVLHERLIALGPDKPPPSLAIAPVDAQAGGLPDLTLESGRTALDRLVTDADLVVIDGLSALVRTGRGVGARWAALADWLRALRRRGAAVLLVDVAEPRAVPLLADTVLKVEPPADGVAEADLRLQVKRLSSRPHLEPRRFELRMMLRKDGAAWTQIDDLDHRAIMAYRLDRADYSSREIAKLLDVSPATAWRLVTRGARLPPHLRDGVDLDVPIPPKPRKNESLLPREKEGPARDSVREDEGPAVLAVSADAGQTDSGGERPSSDPLPRARVPEGEAEREAPGLQTRKTGEAVKHSAAKTLDEVPTDALVAVYLARRRHSKNGTPPPADALSAFSYDELLGTARARLSARVLNRKILDGDSASARPLTRAERLWRTPLHVLMKARGSG